MEPRLRLNLIRRNKEEKNKMSVRYDGNKEDFNENDDYPGCEDKKKESSFPFAEYLMLFHFLKKEDFSIYLENINLSSEKTYEFSVLSEGRFSTPMEAYDFFTKNKFTVTRVRKTIINNKEYYIIRIKSHSEYFDCLGSFPEKFSNEKSCRCDHKVPQKTKQIMIIILIIISILLTMIPLYILHQKHKIKEFIFPPLSFESKVTWEQMFQRPILNEKSTGIKIIQEKKENSVCMTK